MYVCMYVLYCMHVCMYCIVCMCVWNERTEKGVGTQQFPKWTWVQFVRGEVPENCAVSQQLSQESRARGSPPLGECRDPSRGYPTVQNLNKIAADYCKIAKSQAIMLQDTTFQQKCMYWYAGKGRQCHSTQ